MRERRSRLSLRSSRATASPFLAEQSRSPRRRLDVPGRSPHPAATAKNKPKNNVQGGSA
jgi:hypothetical protein